MIRHCTTHTMTKRKPVYSIRVNPPPTEDPEQREKNIHNMNVMVKYLMYHLNHLPNCMAVSSPDIVTCSGCRAINIAMNEEML